MTTLSEEIGSWDGKSAAALQSTYECHGAEADFVARILARVAEVESQRAATWLLKRCLEAGNSLSAAECRTLFGVLSDQDHWESQLHILRCLPHLKICEERLRRSREVSGCLYRERTEVRQGMAYNGFNELSMRFPRYREEVDGMLARASESEAASVRERIRNILRSR